MMKKKIAHVVVTPVMAGAQKVCFEILNSLSEEQYERYLICGLDNYVENTSFFNRFENIGITIIKVPTLKRDIGKHDLSCFFDLIKIFRQHRFDIVHTHSTKAGVVARIAAKISNTNRVIHTVHGISFHRYETTIKRFFYYVVELFSSLFSNDIITVNNYYKKYYRFLPFVNLETIYNGICFDTFEVSKVKDSTINILFLARLDLQKNPFFLINAIEKIKDESLGNLNIKVRIVGDGPLKEELVAYVEKLGLNNFITFKGWTDDVSYEFSRADIFCVPSNYEAFGLVFLESAYFEIPTVTTCVEGIPEVVVHNKTGLLCQPNDIDSLSSALLCLINDDQLRKNLGRKAKKHALNFSVSNMVGAYASLYNKNGRKG
ncbi:TPA: glycosyltransferase family 4 protein [Vibrio cholerae]|uniref:glycosyltransferase family 4 protein n=4 Tax=Vibrio cholerae TaxID=666 RepID=UPI0011D3F30A|nr:glycosyltransferase family 4 protein [Vibrio cholerae]ELW1717338.1 glycosyltransferase family 4 protein [Vibrio cholerae]EMC8146070.1 glycosyltransferase family 4 protein [Vibrio cholerae]TXZ60372.1 glycosyltransferase family 4 protein [Vibrio cholerae]BCN20818.1 N-acetyl-alpha-D-glucosaminyl L-malate synthase [Vibrio cholerae]GHW14673.1 Exopolysaccharide biosynthesis glycosyltransferase EpsF [Vibrio cholerae]